MLRVAVEIDPHLLNEAQDILRPLVDQNFEAAQIVFVAAGDEGVGDMQAVVVVFFVDDGGRRRPGRESCCTG